jgi:hypothetical protein
LVLDNAGIGPYRFFVMCSDANVRADATFRYVSRTKYASIVDIDIDAGAGRHTVNLAVRSTE